MLVFTEDTTGRQNFTSDDSLNSALYVWSKHQLTMHSRGITITENREAELGNIQK